MIDPSTYLTRDNSKLLFKPRTRLQSHSLNASNSTNNIRKHSNIGFGENDLCEMIEKVQGTRYENQRCELNQDFSATRYFNKMMLQTQTKPQTQTEQIYDNHQPASTIKTQYSSSQHSIGAYNSTISTNTNSISTNSNSTFQSSTIKSINSLNYSPERLESILNQDTNSSLYPMISLPSNNNYWSEGWMCNTTELDQQQMVPEAFIRGDDRSVAAQIELDINEIASQDSIIDKDHVDFYGQDTKDSPIILSYKYEKKEDMTYIRAILRTKEDNYYSCIPLPSIEEPVIPHKICKYINPSIKIKFFHQLSIPNGTSLLKNFDDHTISKTFKFGIIYMKKGQITEEELFSNATHDESFEEFLNFIGQKIKLKDFKGYKGGLDTSCGQTGDESVYENFCDKEIMFHVSTLLPYSKTDNQQLERKRHIGNDIVTIVFQDDNTPFAPDMIASNFLHSFIVIQKVKTENNENTKYRVAVSSRSTVPNFSPVIPECATFEKSQLFKDWLLLKLINAENACCKADKFKRLKERTRMSLIDELYKELTNQNQKFMNELNTNNFFCSTHKEKSFDSDDKQSTASSGASSQSNFNTNGTENSYSAKNLRKTISTPTKNPSNSQSKAMGFFQTVKKAFNSRSNKSSVSEDKDGQKMRAKDSFVNSTYTLPHNTTPAINDDVKQAQNVPIMARMRSATIDSPTLNKNFSKSLKEKNHDLVKPEYARNVVIKNPKNARLLNSKSVNSSEMNLNQASRVVSLGSSFETADMKTLHDMRTNLDVNEHEYAIPHKFYDAQKNRNIDATQGSNKENTMLVDHMDTGLGNLSPNSSGISSSASISVN